MSIHFIKIKADLISAILVSLLRVYLSLSLSLSLSLVIRHCLWSLESPKSPPSLTGELYISDLMFHVSFCFLSLSYTQYFKWVAFSSLFHSLPYSPTNYHDSSPGDCTYHLEQPVAGNGHNPTGPGVLRGLHASGCKCQFLLCYSA